MMIVLLLSEASCPITWTVRRTGRSADHLYPRVIPRTLVRRGCLLAYAATLQRLPELSKRTQEDGPQEVAGGQLFASEANCPGSASVAQR